MGIVGIELQATPHGNAGEDVAGGSDTLSGCTSNADHEIETGWLHVVSPYPRANERKRSDAFRAAQTLQREQSQLIIDSEQRVNSVAWLTATKCNVSQ
jgi:hypothetical protein